MPAAHANAGTDGNAGAVTHGGSVADGRTSRNRSAHRQSGDASHDRAVTELIGS